MLIKYTRICNFDVESTLEVGVHLEDKHAIVGPAHTMTSYNT